MSQIYVHLSMVHLEKDTKCMCEFVKLVLRINAEPTEVSGFSNILLSMVHLEKDMKCMCKF